VAALAARFLDKKIPERRAPNRKTLSTTVSSKNSTTAITFDNLIKSKPPILKPSHDLNILKCLNDLNGLNPCFRQLAVK
jgi:hypothetical protein